MDFSDNKNLKYLNAELLKQNSDDKRAELYASYLGCCRFNTQFSPNSIIEFTDEEARNLAQWAALQIGEQPSNEIPQVIKCPIKNGGGPRRPFYGLKSVFWSRLG